MLSREDLVIAITELMIDYRKDIIDLALEHSDILSKISTEEEAELLQTESMLILSMTDKVEDLNSAIQGLQKEYLALTKPMKH